jgi:hypothetical protein
MDVSIYTKGSIVMSKNENDKDLILLLNGTLVDVY